MDALRSILPALLAAAALAGRCDERSARTEGSAPPPVQGRDGAAEGPKIMVNQQRIATEAEAVQRALQLTGFDALPDVEARAERVIVADSQTPFLAKQIVGRPAWRVELAKVSLVLRSAVAGFQDRYRRRRFSVLLDEENGKLLEITSKYAGPAPEMRPEPSAFAAEAQLSAEKEIYLGFPDHDPKVRFLGALDAILAGGIGSPFYAKEIDGVYVSHSEMGSSPRDVWVITLRGLPPIPAHGRAADTVPAWQRNHMRNIVDADTGKVLSATNSPQPN
jgi:hypothetical protein